MPRSDSRRRGTFLLEFTLTGVPLIFTLISLFYVSIGMWQYHSIAEAVNATARTASLHGAGCVGKTCATTVDSVAREIASRSIGIPASQMNVTLSSTAAGASPVSCNPLSNCYGNSAAYPSTATQTTSTSITISATFQFTSAISFWSPAGKMVFNAIVLGANSSQPIGF